MNLAVVSYQPGFAPHIKAWDCCVLLKYLRRTCTSRAMLAPACVSLPTGPLGRKSASHAELARYSRSEWCGCIAPELYACNPPRNHVFLFVLSLLFVLFKLSVAIASIDSVLWLVMAKYPAQGEGVSTPDG